MSRRDIHVQTGLAVALLISVAVALGMTGFSFQQTEAAYAREHTPVTRNHTSYRYITEVAGRSTSYVSVPVSTYLTTHLPYRRQVTSAAAAMSTAVATSTEATAVGAPPAAPTAAPTATPSASPPPAARAMTKRARPASNIGTLILVNMPWLGLLFVYLVAFLVVRHMRPDSWFVAVAADLSFLGCFWLCGSVCAVMTAILAMYDSLSSSSSYAPIPGFVLMFVSWGILTAWWIWEIAVAKGYRRGLKTSLVRIVEAHAVAVGTRKIDLDVVAREYLARDPKALAT